jgi:hypothetical protein
MSRCLPNSWIYIQLRTTKVNQLSISGIFWRKSDDRSETGRAKEAQKWCFRVIPTHFGRAKNLSKIFGLYQAKFRDLGFGNSSNQPATLVTGVHDGIMTV